MSWLSHLAFWRSPKKELTSTTSGALPSTPKNKAHEVTSDDISTSPYTRVKHWLTEAPSEVSSTWLPLGQPNKGKHTHEDDNGEDDEWTSVPAKRHKKCVGDNGEASDIFELEGSALVAASSPPPGEKSTFNGHPDIWEHAVDANDETIVVETAYDKPTARAFAEECQHRDEEASSLSTFGWSQADVDLFRHLHMRGFAPLLPSHWEKDFSILPSALFTPDLDRAVIRSLSKKKGADFRATKALESLLELGPKVRDKIISNKPPELLVKQAVEAYVRWSMADAGLSVKGRRPILAIQTGNKDMDSAELQNGVVSKLEKLYSSWCETNSVDSGKPPPPPLYGIVISHTIMAFVSFIPPPPLPTSSPHATPSSSSSSPCSSPPTSSTTSTSPSSRPKTNPSQQAQKLRTIAMFDLGKIEYDVWNSFAIAILAVHCRGVVVESFGGGGGNGSKGVRVKGEKMNDDVNKTDEDSDIDA